MPNLPLVIFVLLPLKDIIITSRSTARNSYALPHTPFTCPELRIPNQGHSCPQANVFGGSTPPNTKGKNLTAAGLAALADLNFGYADSSEDCLTLNVWTRPQFGEKGKAVLIWVYGGGYTIGSSSDPIYDGQYIADQEDVVLVTFKYVPLSP
jgi:hypothetical protein